MTGLGCFQLWEEDKIAKKNKIKERYIKNFNTFSEKEQNLLIKSHVSIIGLGGLGGCVCEMLARTGVGNLILIDGDSFDKSNLNRQILSTEKLISP